MLGKETRVALACAAIALVACGMGVYFTLSVQGDRSSALVRMQPDEPMARLARQIDPGFAFNPQGHYDGVYAYAIALDPTAHGVAHTLIDYPEYRYGRAGLGWLAWLLSFGQGSGVPRALMLIGLLGAAGGAFFASAVSTQLGWSAWGGLVVALNPGVIYGATSDTSEPLQALLMGAGLFLWFRRKLIPAALVFVFLCLVKEQYAMVPLGLALWEVVKSRRNTAEPDIAKRIALLVCAPIPLAVWWVYLHGIFGKWPFDQPWLVAAPVLGWLDTMHRAASMGVATALETQIGTASLPLLIAVGLSFVLAAILALRLRTPLDCIFLGLVVIASVLSWWQLLFPKEMIRILASQVALVPAVLAGARQMRRARPPAVVDAPPAAEAVI